MRRRSGFMAIVLLLIATSFSILAQEQPVGRVKNLTVPEFDAQNRRKAVLHGAEMVTGKDNVWQITGLKIESYAGGDKPAWIVEAPECSYHDPTKRAWSAGALTARSTDGQLEISGLGFEWRQPEQLLVISNAVRTLLHPRGTNTTAATPSLARQDLELTAQHLNFNAQKMIAIYRGDVRARELLPPGATNPPVTLDCGIFSIHLNTNGSGVQVIEAEEKMLFTQGATRAAGDRAVYTASNDVITVTGHASWATELAEGRGDTLVLDRKQQVVQSRGNSFARLRAMDAKVSGGKTNEVLELTAENLTARPPTTNQPQTELQADGAVTIRRGDQQAGGSRMIYTGTLTNGVAELTGMPWWRTPEAEGTADRLSFDRSANAFRGRGQGRVKLVRQPAQPDGKPQTMTIQADEYDVSDAGATLRGNLVAADPQWQIQGEEMRLSNALGTRRLREVTLQKNVHVQQQLPVNTRQVPWKLQCDELRMFMAPDGSRIARITATGAIQLEPARAATAGESSLPWKLQCQNADLTMGANGQWDSMVAQNQVRLDPLPGVTNNFPWAMTSQQLSLFMAPGQTNQIERAVAERDVRLRQTANPREAGGGVWQLDCDRATVRFAAGHGQVQTADAEGNVRAVQLDGQGGNPAWTLTGATASLKMGASNRVEQITAQHQVRITQSSASATNGPPLQVGCESVTAELGASNTVETLMARESVVIEQGRSRATGTTGIYHNATGDFELTGQPRLVYVEDQANKTNAVPRQIKIEGANILIWNRNSNQFRGKGPYRITPVGPLDLKKLQP